MSNGFTRFVSHHRRLRHWTIAELAHRARLTQPEVSRVESGSRNPTLRLVRGLAEAFSKKPTHRPGEPETYENWLSVLVDLGESARIETRKSKREAG